MAEGQGFEPWIPLGMLVFKTSAFNRSATPPRRRSLEQHVSSWNLRSMYPASSESIILRQHYKNIRRTTRRPTAKI